MATSKSRATVAGLQSYLKRALPTSSVRAIDRGAHPIVLLQTDQLIAAFAVPEGDLDHNYKRLYQSFKDRFREQREEWHRLDVSFILCVSPDVPNLERFCSSIETDVFFCRKFVVPFVDPLAESLARLPFLPLSRVDDQPIRPPSAQTFLQRSGVPSALAKLIVTPRERGAERIVEDCLNGVFGPPVRKTLETSVGSAIPASDREYRPVRLHGLTIAGFRAYNKVQRFRFGEDITILYGPNGFGKTSFFDAVDFAITGEIGRFKRRSDVRQLAKHLDCNAHAESYVSLQFSCGGADHHLKRLVSTPKNADLDGVPAERKRVLAELTGAPGAGADRVENAINLFRATHLFSQEHQELASGFHESSELSADIVSRLLAFEDYSIGISKIEKIEDDLAGNERQVRNEIELIQGQIDKERDQLPSDGAGAGPDAPQAVEGAALELGAQLQSEGLIEGTFEISVPVVRQWRAVLAAAAAESRSQQDRYRKLAEEVAGLSELDASRGSTKAALETKDGELGSARARRVSVDRDLVGLREEFSRQEPERAACEARVAALEWLGRNLPGFRALESDHARIAASIVAFEAELAAKQRLAQECLQRGSVHEQSLKHFDGQISEGRRKADLLKNLALRWPDSQKLSSEAERLESDMVERRARLTSLRQREPAEVLHHREASLAHEDAATRLREAQSSASSLSSLLSELQDHVADGTCLLCGVDHGSKEALVARIQDQLATDGARDARDLERLRRESLAEASSGLETIRKEIEQVSAQIQRDDAQIALVRRQLDEFRQELVASGMPSQTPNTTIQTWLDDAIATNEISVDALRRRRDEQAGAHAAVELEARQHLDAISAIKPPLEAARTRSSSIIKSIITTRSDPRFRELQGRQDDQVEPHLQSTSARLQELAAVCGTLTQKIASLTAEESALRSRLAFWSTEREGLVSELARLDARKSAIESRLAGIGLSSSVQLDQIIALAKDQADRQVRLDHWQDRAAGIETALDVVATSITVSKLKASIAAREANLLDAETRLGRIKTWTEYFRTLYQAVVGQQADATRGFTSSYGPRTSVIQRRLRAVYGFDDVEIRSHESAIQVRVMRRGEELRPIDFFSQSQQQTLLLGLFLTACVSQTWSSLAPIFLDDPVTHFDDLNTYAFLDMLVGLVEAEPQQRQFVISTCDERFLQLALQKFRHFKQGAKFYRFTAIGTDGPIVEEIPQSSPASPAAATTQS